MTATSFRWTATREEKKIRRAMLSGPSCVTSEATVAEMNLDGSMTVLRPGTHPHRPALDAHLAVRREGRRDRHEHA
jgi:hypothetical protein